MFYMPSPWPNAQDGNNLEWKENLPELATLVLPVV